MTDEELILKVLGSLPNQYSTIVTLLEQELNKGTLTVKLLRDNLRRAFQKLVVAKAQNPSDRYGMLST